MQMHIANVCKNVCKYFTVYCMHRKINEHSKCGNVCTKQLIRITVSTGIVLQ